MSSQPHLQIFNYIQTPCDEESKFHRFPQLPLEIRQMIWLYSLQRERIIRLYLEEFIDLPSTQEAEDATNKSARYCVSVNGYQVLSKLLRLNRESRDVALRFYRVHFPCILRRGPLSNETRRRGFLYFNPENDFLYIRAEHNSKPLRQMTLPDFLYRLKIIYDPKQIGLLNLAIDASLLERSALLLLRISDLDPAVGRAFVETLTQLHEVFIVRISRFGRQTFGTRRGLRPNRRQPPDEAPFNCWIDETKFNRSVPIVPMTPTFDRLSHDPRPIGQDLGNTNVGEWCNLFNKFLIWQRHLKNWKISPPHTEYRLLLGSIPRREVYDYESAMLWLREEDYQWRKWLGVAEHSLDGDDGQGKPESKPKCPAPEKFLDEDLEKAVKPAFGFWLFPLHLFSSLLPREGFEPIVSLDSRTRLNLNRNWPDLALSSLP
jgi:hypothetical protein